jgi:hypothetical protein
MVELVLSMTLMSLVSVAAVPSFINVGSAACDGAARKLVSDLSYARRLAQTRNAVYGITFDASAQTYTVHLYDPVTNLETSVGDPLTGTPMIVDFDEIPGLKGVQIQNPDFGGGATTRFTPQGVPEDAAGNPLVTEGRIVLARGGTLRTILIQPNTGEVSYQ